MAAEFYYTAADVSIGGDLSAQVVGATLNHSVETPDATAMGATNRVTVAGGLEVWSMDVEFNNSYTDATGVEALLDACMTAGATCTLKPTGTGPAAHNPGMTGTWVCESYAAAQGSTGDLGRTTGHFVPAGAITWARG